MKAIKVTTVFVTVLYAFGFAEPLMLAFSDEALMLIAQADIEDAAGEIEIKKEIRAPIDNSWMTPEEAELAGVTLPPKPQIQQPPPPPPKIKTLEERVAELEQEVASSQQYTTNGIRAATALAFAVGLPGGGSFYLGRSKIGMLHIMLQVGAPVGFGIWAGHGGGTIPLVIAIGLPVISKVTDMFSSYNSALGNHEYNEY